METNKEKILVVDDEASIRRILETRLSMIGYDVVTAADGEEALETFRTAEPSLVVLDVMMPSKKGEDGFSLCSRIKETPQTAHMPVFLLTAIAVDAKQSEEDLKERAGADDFVSKPFEPDDLLQRIKVSLRKGKK